MKTFTRTISREQLMNKLKRAYPKMHVSTTEDFSGSTGGIWLGAECVYDRNEMPVFDYWTENYTSYTFGVINHFYNFLERNGWYAEWYDCGTIMLYEI